MRIRERSGFTLIELLIFSAIFALIIGVFITIFIEFVSVQSNQSASGETQQQGQFLDQQLQYYIESARLVDMTLDTATGTLTLREAVASSALDPTIFTLNSGRVYLQQGISGTPQALTSNRVTISNLLFTRHYSLNSSSSPLGTDSVSYSYTVASAQGNQTYSQVFQSSAAVAAPVPAIALIQQVKVENNNPSSVSLTGRFPTSNESGDLLLAVVGYQGTGTSSVSDTNGNTWSKVISTSTAGGGTVTLYAAQNAAAGLDTTTVAFASGATYTSLFLYEYRGASTGAALDVSGAQLQTSVSAPISPSLSPKNGNELLIGIDGNSAPTTAAFSSAAGYTLETSSTVGNTTQVFVEDQNQYITNPIAAAWTSSVNTTSTAIAATFTATPYLNPVVRGTGLQAATNGSFTVSWPAGTVAGDLAVIFEGGDYNIGSVPSGWTQNQSSGGPSWWTGTVLSKVLTSTDITNGSVGITCNNADAVVGIVTFVGGTAGIREVDALQYSSGQSSITSTSGAGVLTTDTAIYFGSNRSVSTDSMNRGTLQHQTNDGNAASGALYTEALTAAGSYSAIGSYTSPGNGNYQAMVIVKGQ